MKKREPTFHCDAMTWLNGRAIKIVIMDKTKKKTILYDPSLTDFTIEDCIDQYCKSNNIDILREIGE